MIKPSYLILFFCFCSIVSTAQTVGTYAANVGIDDYLLFDEAGNLYGSNFDGSSVFKIAPDGTVSTFVDGLGAPNGLAFDSQGNFFVVDHYGNKVYKVPPGGEKEEFATLTRPSGLLKEIDSDTLIITWYTQRKISKLAPDGTLHDFVADNDLLGPVGLTYDEFGNLYAANFDNRKIFRVCENGDLEFIVQIPGVNMGFLWYLNGYLYATLFQSHKIYRIDLDGNYEVIAGSSAGSVDGDVSVGRFNGPNGIIANATGDTLFISDYFTKSVRFLTGLETIVPDSVGCSIPVDVDVAFGKEPEISISPNPVADNARILIQLSEAAEVSVDLFDLTGVRVQNILPTRFFPEGVHSVDFKPGNLPAGIYLCRLRLSNDTMQMKKIFITR